MATFRLEIDYIPRGDQGTAIDALVREGVAHGGELPDRTRVVYVSPLKALSNDIQRNLGFAIEGRRVLLFSQFTGMLAIIAAAVEKAGIDYVMLTGDTTDRATPVRRFQAGEVPLFLISLKAGGVGLNLPQADTVIHYDPWWNPAAEAQATDRAHRIGQ